MGLSILQETRTLLYFPSSVGNLWAALQCWTGSSEKIAWVLYRPVDIDSSSNIMEHRRLTPAHRQCSCVLQTLGPHATPSLKQAFIQDVFSILHAVRYGWLVFGDLSSYFDACWQCIDLCIHLWR